MYVVATAACYGKSV